MKMCPYCVKRLPFFNTVWQRITASEDSALKCGNCGSVISSNGGALLLDAGIASIVGFVVSEALRDASIKTIIISVCIGVVVFIISSYFTAPIRNA